MKLCQLSPQTYWPLCSVLLFLSIAFQNSVIFYYSLQHLICHWYTVIQLSSNVSTIFELSSGILSHVSTTAKLSSGSPSHVFTISELSSGDRTLFSTCISSSSTSSSPSRNGVVHHMKDGPKQTSPQPLWDGPLFPWFVDVFICRNSALLMNFTRKSRKFTCVSFEKFVKKYNSNTEYSGGQCLGTTAKSNFVQMIPGARRVCTYNI